MIRNTKVQLALGLAISALFLFLTLKPVKLADLWVAVLGFKWLWAVPFLLATFASMWARAVRWHYLMRPTARFTSTRLFSPMMAGFAINSLFPGRVGEFARAYVLAAREKLKFSGVFATIVLERVFDSITLLVLLVVTFATLKIDPALKLSYGKFEVTGAILHSASVKLAYFCAILLAGSCFLLLDRGRRLIQWMVKTVPFAPRRIRFKFSEMVGHFADGLASLRDPKSMVIIILLSLAVWVLVGWSMQILAYGFSGMHMTLTEGIAITVITCIAILIPAAPGYWGLMEVGIVFGLVVLNVEPVYTRALGYAFVCHSLQIFPIIVVGLFCLWKERVSLGEISRKSHEE